MLLDPSPNRATVLRQAPAKLNLALAVGPPRPTDGYHPICSWMATIDLADELLVTRLEDDRLSRYAVLWHEHAPVRSDINWSITKDLAVRAHMLLERVAGRSLPVQLKLEKRIPVGGGLGGGSSDAAAMLLATRELFALELDDHALLTLSHQLGSDVPFFVQAALTNPSTAPGHATRSNAALIWDMGQSVAPAPSVAATGLLILPDFGCPTGSVYRAFDDSPLAADTPAFQRRAQLVRDMATAQPPIEPTTTRPNDQSHWSRALFNDLATPAQGVAPALRRILDAAADIAEAPVHVTGSGSACFLILDHQAPADEPAINALRADLLDELPGCAVIPFRCR